MVASKQNSLIVVLGMHRSGTSALTKGLQALGVDLGERLFPPVPGVNAKGFFEDEEIVFFNDELLSMVDSCWHSLAIIPSEEFFNPKYEDIKSRAVKILQSRIGKCPYGLKDPRMARLLPFWLDVFERSGACVSFVIAVRNPMSVAWSLNKRDGFEDEKSYLLWLEHMLPAIIQSRGYPRIAVDFDSLMASPKKQLARIAKSLGLGFDENSSLIRDYGEKFLEPSLRNTQFDREELRKSSQVSDDILVLYDVLSGFAADTIDINEPSMVKVVDEASGRLLKMQFMLNYVESVDRERIKLRQRVLELNSNVLELNSNISTMLDSKSWRVTQPLRKANLYLSSLQRLWGSGK